MRPAQKNDQSLIRHLRQQVSIDQVVIVLCRHRRHDHRPARCHKLFQRHKLYAEPVRDLLRQPGVGGKYPCAEGGEKTRHFLGNLPKTNKANSRAVQGKIGFRAILQPSLAALSKRLMLIDQATRAGQQHGKPHLGDGFAKPRRTGQHLDAGRLTSLIVNGVGKAARHLDHHFQIRRTGEIVHRKARLSRNDGTSMRECL